MVNNCAMNKATVEEFQHWDGNIQLYHELH